MTAPSENTPSCYECLEPCNTFKLKTRLKSPEEEPDPLAAEAALQQMGTTPEALKSLTKGCALAANAGHAMPQFLMLSMPVQSPVVIEQI